MGHIRDTGSRIWPGEPGWVGSSLQRCLDVDEKKIAMNQMEVTLYARAFCMSTWRVKRLLRHKGYFFDVVDVADYEDSWCPLGGSLGSKTLPQVFVAGRPLGGFDEISALDRSGDLDRLLRGEM